MIDWIGRGRICLIWMMKKRILTIGVFVQQIGNRVYFFFLRLLLLLLLFFFCFNTYHSSLTAIRSINVWSDGCPFIVDALSPSCFLCFIWILNQYLASVKHQRCNGYHLFIRLNCLWSHEFDWLFSYSFFRSLSLVVLEHLFTHFFVPSL